MASQVPDPRTLNSWEDAFQHPLPVVRKLEQQLRKNIDENRQKLRSLVGASYRDLLGTAERIIEMDEQMKRVETYLGDIGRKCNASTVEKISANYGRTRKTREIQDDDKYRVAAQTQVLRSALTMGSRIVKRRGDALQASKLVVLSRLLLKSISDLSPGSAMVEDLKRRLTLLRKRLLSYIERTMAGASPEKSILAHVLCAYALVTSSTPKDVLRHFLQVRYEQLDSAVDSPSEADILQMLDLYSGTLLDTRDLFPRRFAEALAQIAKLPLLRDDQVQSVSELNLDIYGPWISDDIKTFTPWLRHDQLTTTEVADALHSWTNQAQECLLHNVRSYLRQQEDARVALSSRRSVISRFMALSSRLRGQTHSKAIQDLREVFLDKLKELALRSASLDDLALQDVEIKEYSQFDNNDHDMWSLVTEDLDLSNGALKFREAVVRRRHGRDHALQAQIEKLDTWLGRIQGLVDIADEMLSTKWDDDLDFDIDDLEDGEALQNLLSKEDSTQLRNELCKALRKTLDDSEAKIGATGGSSKHAIFYLRLWREIDQRRHALQVRLELPNSQIRLASLHNNIAVIVSKDGLEQYIDVAKRRSYAAVTLWDGSPPLPVQPSPAAFKFLTQIHRSMSEAGSDLWSSQCIAELRSVIIDCLSTNLHDKAFASPRNPSILANGHTGEDEEESGGGAAERSLETPTQEEAHMVQKLFDLYYIARIFNPRVVDYPGQVAFVDVMENLRTPLRLNGEAKGRLQKSADDYWKRTYLLFGLLAPGSQGSG